MESLKSQLWRSDDGTVERDGEEFAKRLKDLGVYDDPESVLSASKIGDRITTGVSAYERIK